MMTTNPTGKPVKKTPAKKVPTKKVSTPKQQSISPLIPGYGLTRKPGYESMSGKKGISIKKAKDGDLLNKVSKTKLKDVPAKAEKLGKKVIEKGKKFASDTVEKVKNTTMGDAAKTASNTIQTVRSFTPGGIAYKLARRAASAAANSDIGKQIKEDLKPERQKQALKNIGAAFGDVFGFKNGGAMKKKMRNGGSLSGLKASAKRVGPVDPKGAYTKVQKKTLKGAKGKASLTKDKQLGATKMAKRGMSIKKK